jgi:hypothetical protein
MQMIATTQHGSTTTASERNSRITRSLWLAASVGVMLLGLLAAPGCFSTPVDTSEKAQGPAPRRMPSPSCEAEGHHSYEDSLTGGQIFAMYCSYCHNAPTLAERPFSNFQTVAAHMRNRANLTGKEYAKLMEFLRRWNDIPPPSPPQDPSPKRLIFSQPMNELRPEQPANVNINVAPPDGQPKDGKK